MKLKLSTEPKVIKTKDIDTIEFKLIFPIKQNYDNNYYISLLGLYLTTTSNKYPDHTEFRKEKLRHTLLGLSFFSNTYVDNTYLVYSFSTPRERLITDFDLESTFEFAIDTLLHPLCSNEEFDLKKFEYEKSFIVSNHERALDGIYASNSNKFYDTIDPEEELGNSYDKNTLLLEKINNKDLYKFYKESILDNTCISYVYGNVSEAKIKKLFSKYLPQSKKTISFDINYFKPMPIKKRRYEEVITHYNQSELIMEYQVDMIEKERRYLAIIINILRASENNLIYEALRVKNNLVYDARIETFNSRAMFVIISFISKENYKETKKIIGEVFKSLHDEKYMQECLNKLIKGLEVDLLKESDSLTKPLDDIINHDLKIKTTKEALEEFKKAKVKDLVSFLDRIKLTNEMFFRGDK